MERQPQNNLIFGTVPQNGIDLDPGPSVNALLAGDRHIAAPASPPGSRTAAGGTSDLDIEAVLQALGLELQPDFLGGWRVVPKRWPAPPGGKPYNGLMFRREF